MAGTPQGGKKAAANRSEESLKKAGEAGAAARHAKNPQEESRIAQKAADTRQKNDPNAFSNMGKSGGQASGGRRSDED